MSASVSPSTPTRRTEAGTCSCSSGVSFGTSSSGSSEGSPTGSEPSGSRRAARCPCVRCALTRAMAAAMPPSSCASGACVGSTLGCGGGGATCAPPFAPLPRKCGSCSTRRAMPGCVATSWDSPLSNSARHSDGTASGFSRYSSRRARAYPAFRPSTSCVLTPVLYQGRPAYPSRSEERVVSQDLQSRADDEADPDDRIADGDDARLLAAHHRRDEEQHEHDRRDPKRAVEELERPGE